MINKRLIGKFVVLGLNVVIILFISQKLQQPTFKKLAQSDILPSPRPLQVKGESISEERETVKDVIDGDTIKLASGETVRYIGIDTPENSKSVECFALEAKTENEKLVLGKNVKLEKDVSETDKYGRLLRYVYVADSDGGEIFVNEYLVRQGFAAVATYPPDVKYQDLFLNVQKKAREESFGLWSKCR